MKKSYISPVLMSLNPGEGDVISFGGSQDTMGDISMFDISALDVETQDNIREYCGYLDLQDMDTSGDLVISQAEFDAWYAENPWW